MLRIRKDDMIEVVSGKDKGKKGKVIAFFPKTNKVLVEGINFVKKGMRRTQQEQKGGIIEKEAPLHASNVMIVCKRCDKPIKTGVSFLKDGSKTRICRSCKEII